MGGIKWGMLAALVIVVTASAALFMGGARFLVPEVEIAPVRRGTAVNAVPGVVTVAAERMVELRSENGGRLVESRMEAGRRVEAGEVLARFDDQAVLRALERVAIDLEAEEALRGMGPVARFDLEKKREELGRMETWREAGRAAEEALTDLRRAISRLETELETEEIRRRQRIRNLDNEQRRLEEERERLLVRAPEAGEITEVLAWPDDLVPSRGLVGRLLAAGRRVEAGLSEENFAGVAVGKEATVRFLSYGREVFPARVSRVVPVADSQTQRYTVHLEVELPEERLVPGMTGEVSIVLAERENALLIPRRAMVGNQVFVVNERGRVDLRRVERGFTSLTQVEILSGLEEGEKIVVENLDRLRDGDRVRIADR